MKKILMFLLILFFCLTTNLSANAYGFGFKKNNNHLQPEIGKYNNEIYGTDSYYVGDSNEKVVYLTFDVGYDNGCLSKVLDILKEKNVESTFFVTGDFFDKGKELIIRMVNEGHIVGNHTYDHKNITKLSYDELEEQLVKVENKYYEITGKDMIKYFRPPEGEFNKQSLMNVKKAGYKTFFWSIAYVDWNTKNQKNNNYAYEVVMNNLHNGAIILMHTVSKDNLNNLGSIIDGIRNEGYEIKNLNEFK